MDCIIIFVRPTLVVGRGLSSMPNVALALLLIDLQHFHLTCRVFLFEIHRGYELDARALYMYGVLRDVEQGATAGSS
jgi:hypothetical protein